MRLIVIIFIVFFSLLFGKQALAQGEKKPLQLSGLVVSGEESFGVYGVFVYVPSAGRGSTTNYYGYFSLPVFPDDSVVVRAVGYKTKTFKIPEDTTENISVIVHIDQDTVTLPVIEVTSFPTEDVFKEAVLSLSIPGTDYKNMRSNLNKQIMTRMLATAEMDASMNHTYFMQQQANEIAMEGIAPSTAQLLNPFAWAQFIKSIKDSKRRKEEEEEEKRRKYYYRY